MKRHNISVYQTKLHLIFDVLRIEKKIGKSAFFYFSRNFTRTMGA